MHIENSEFIFTLYLTLLRNPAWPSSEAGAEIPAGLPPALNVPNEKDASSSTSSTLFILASTLRHFRAATAIDAHAGHCHVEWPSEGQGPVLHQLLPLHHLLCTSL